ncbi:hypothetical protein PRZ48_013995 [Zasmidium cellare]|uniref:Heterokaryon incompatibility domain-containing protein n=1 Tax=Zasmidium cellare TaxID=395010 RepID=A0ABR0DZW9_ZASCE|nr:hypothetical protein PRZ48_013995 [Zasmidium cellare]
MATIFGQARTTEDRADLACPPLPMKSQPAGPFTDTTPAHACGIRRSIPRLWRWLIAADFTSAKYLRFYSSAIGLSRIDLLNAQLHKTARIVFQGHITPERLRDRTESWISESLDCRTALPSTRLDVQTCPQQQDLVAPNDRFQRVYQPLDEHDDTIRLLVLDSKAPKDAIVGRLVLARLLNMPAFRALSYEWGPKARDELSNPKMMLNGHSVPIQPNLHSFLTRLQRYDNHLPLWIDALCINQADDEEKSEQVALMGDIYHGAVGVLVWLGGDGDGDGNLIRFLDGQSPLRLMDLDQVRSRPKYPKQVLASLSVPFDPLVREMLRSESAKQLLRRTYWSRAWIMQELILARRIIMFCGDQVIDFQHLDSLIIRNSRLKGSVPDQVSMMRVGRRNANINNYSLADYAKESPPRDRTAEDKTGWLPYLMEMFEHTQCSRRHDKVYSLVGLCHFYKEGPHPIIPDYRISMIELFRQTFNTFVRDRRPKYAEILRRALDLNWKDLLPALQTEDHTLCSFSSGAAYWWDTAWGSAITKVDSTLASTEMDESWYSFETDYLERHKHIDSFHEHIERQSMETRGTTRAAVRRGDILLGLAGTAIALILSEKEGDHKLIGLALMVGTRGAPGDKTAHAAYQRVLLPGFITRTSIAGDCFRSGQFAVRLCVYQFITLLACAIPAYDTANKLPAIPMELLRQVSLHATRHDAKGIEV